jgi:hypothetical protein
VQGPREVEKFQEVLDDGVEVGEEGVMCNAFA